ncbi:alpha/beta fold hydrolase [Halopelagius longus]|uniref:Alpha/beta fold hydrolase n=1 Tax=Halopelagius longus TaxID=1236180 RepID=A0A1H1E9K3_9EURY|nr:alpha/beta fold hydrolase [Halopelagius longus]RDI71662.1 alpha/beta fold hydrolase [Halopelagius longus]SDQ85334.1 Pimeloyl-ACP methyl ester carboxylesterase [Halopelagius longus]
MPTASNGSVQIHYEADGEGETVAFVGDAGYGAWQWGWQHAAVAGPYESLVLDVRGTGRSDAPDGPYAVGTLVDDLVAVLADHGVRKAHLVGAGLGGMVALRAARSTSRVRSLALFGTAAYGGGLDLEPLFGAPDDPEELERSLRAAVSERFVEAQPEAFDQILEWRAEEDAPRAAWEAQAAAVERFAAEDLYEVTAPALVVHGTEDAVWPPERGEELATDLPRGEFFPVEGAGHLAHAEASKVVNDELLRFLDEQSASR